MTVSLPGATASWSLGKSAAEKSRKLESSANQAISGRFTLSLFLSAISLSTRPIRSSREYGSCLSFFSLLKDSIMGASSRTCAEDISGDHSRSIWGVTLENAILNFFADTISVSFPYCVWRKPVYSPCESRTTIDILPFSGFLSSISSMSTDMR